MTLSTATLLLLARLTLAQLPDAGARDGGSAGPDGRAGAAGSVDAGGRRYVASDLAPYFVKGKPAQAWSEFDAGRPAEARALLEGQGDSHPVRYLRALSASRAGDQAAAAKLWPLLARDYPVLADRCWYEAGLSSEAIGDWPAAATQFASVETDSLYFADARLGLSRALQRTKDLAGARRALEPLASKAAPQWGRDVAAEALLAMADLARQAKDLPGEKAALVKLWSAHPLSALAAKAEQRLGGVQALPVEALVGRGEVLIENHRNAPGIAVLEPLLKDLALPDPLACRAHFAYGKGLRKERQHVRAAAALAPVADGCKDPLLRPKALYILGQSRAVVHVPKAPATYELLAKDYPQHSYADDALFYAADAYLKLGKKEKAVAQLGRLIERYPTGDFAAEALFKAFWIRYLDQKTKEALGYLDEIERLYANADESYEVERARYWRARLAEGQGDLPKAAALLETLAIEHPATYYGLIARERLGALDPTRVAKVSASLVFPKVSQGPWPLDSGALGTSPRFLRAVELVRLGFPAEAAAELNGLDRAQLGAQELRLLVQVLSVAGDARGAHAVARTSLRRDLSGRITADNRPVWEVAYPNAFRELIEGHCLAANALEPDLLQALMREESALDPKALSWAGALGLTQLMPSTAAGVAAQLKLKKVTTQMLLQPDLNIRLGATYLSNLTKRYGGVRQFALAGYNAGESAVDRWRKQRPTEELDVWVENIPLAETRGYVKRVLRSFNTYQLLYAAPVAAAAAGRPDAGPPGKADAGR